MSNLFEIGRSGVMFYRQALSVTSENIANVNTEGYHKRAAEGAEVAGARSNPFTGATSGQGVGLETIGRAFDELITARVRDAGATLSSNDAYLPMVQMLEQRLTPGVGGMLDMLDGFFDAVSGLALSPSDAGLRRVVIEAGKGYTDAVSSTALDMQNLVKGIQDEADVHVASINRILHSLSELQISQKAASSQAAMNPVLDKRDKLIKDLSGILDITVKTNDLGGLKITMGKTPGGPVLIEDGEAARVFVDEDLRVGIDPHGIGTPIQFRRPQSGMLHGLANALGSVQEAMADFDNWAQAMVRDFNAEHRSGIDSENRRGQDLFSLEGWGVTAMPINRGTASATLTVMGHEDMPEGPIKMVYDAALGAWHSYDDAGVELGQSSTGLTLAGLTVEIDGLPENGDVIWLKRTDGSAVNMHMAIDDISLLAMAADLRVASDVSNTGTGDIAVRKSPQVAPEGIENLADSFTESSGLLDAIEFVSAGTVGYIPANATSLDLYSLGAQSAQQFSAPSTGTFASLNFDFDGQTYDVDLATDADGDAIALPTSVAELAQRLNDGTYLAVDAATGDGTTFSNLGIFSSGGDSGFSMASTLGDIGLGATLQEAGGASHTSLTVSDRSDPSELIVITREGRQISGPIMTEAEAASFITPENGFIEGATYDTSALNDPNGYRGLDAFRASTIGEHTAALGAGGLPVTYTTGARPAPNDQSSFQLWIDGVDQGLIDLDEGTSAKTAVQVLNDAYGVQASGETMVELQIPDDGQVSFTLTSNNLIPLELTASVVGGDLTDVASAINLLSGQTGVTAEVSPDGVRVLMRHSEGETIWLEEFTHSTGGTMGVERVNEAGQSLDGVGFTLGGGGDDSIRFIGEVRLTSQSEFNFEIDGVGVASALDPMTSGLMSQEITAAGTKRFMTFDFDSLSDASVGTDGGDDLAASGLKYSLSLTDVTGETHDFDYATLGLDINSKADLAAQIAASLREKSPQSRLEGAVLAGLPSDGSGFSFYLGQQAYDVTMEGGEAVVRGPEPDRISAYFDVSGSFVVETVGGTLDGSALRLTSNPRDAAAFGLGAADSPETEIFGQPIDPADLAGGDNIFQVNVGGVAYDINLVNAGGSISPNASAGFPGTVSYDAGTGVVSLKVSADAGELNIPPQENAQAGGFFSYGMVANTGDDGLYLESTNGHAIDLTVATQSAAGTRLRFDNLPDEDLLIVMREPGALRLSANMELSDEISNERAVSARVIDAENGLIELYDTLSGHSIATRFIDDKGSIQAAGYDITLSSGFHNGDIFHVEPNVDGDGDGRIAENIVDLRSFDPATRRGGFSDIYMSILTEIGGQVRAGLDRQDTARALNETAERDFSAVSGVDLDTEAANLIQMQQAYQANAQIINIARQLFDTLINVV